MKTYESSVGGASTENWPQPFVGSSDGLMSQRFDDYVQLLERARVDGYLLRPFSAAALASSLYRISARNEGKTAP